MSLDLLGLMTDAAIDTAKCIEHSNFGFSDCLIVAKHVRHACDFTATLVLSQRTG